MATSQASGDDVRAKLRDIFKTSYNEHPQQWSKLWESGDFLPWDRGEPSPALVDLLNEKEDLIGQVTTGGRRKKALVPGCGRGYDVLLLASKGYDAVGLEISDSAVNQCRKLWEQEGSNYFKASPNHGSCEFVLGDFFKDDWVSSAASSQGSFDLIYDYTFFCALPPEARPRWASRTSQLLSRSSEARLICLEFPTHKPPNTGGPPFGLMPETYVAHLSHPGEELPYTNEGYPDMEALGKQSDDQAANDAALVRIAHWQPARTHPIGQGKDWLSIWRHRA